MRLSRPGALYDTPLFERSSSLEGLDSFVPKAFRSPAGEAKS